MATERITVDELRRGQTGSMKPSASTGILALDPANSMGFAHSDGYRGVYCLTDILGSRHPGARLQRLAHWLRKTLANHPTELIAAENSTFGSHNPHVQALHNELRGVIQLVAAELDIDVKLFNPLTIKKFATGSGSAKKIQMIAACKTILGITPMDDNECDAIWVLGLAQRPDCWPKVSPKKTKKPKLKKSERLF